MQEHSDEVKNPKVMIENGRGGEKKEILREAASLSNDGKKLRKNNGTIIHNYTSNEAEGFNNKERSYSDGSFAGFWWIVILFILLFAIGCFIFWKMTKDQNKESLNIE